MKDMRLLTNSSRIVPTSCREHTSEGIKVSGYNFKRGPSAMLLLPADGKVNGYLNFCGPAVETARHLYVSPRSVQNGPLSQKQSSDHRVKRPQWERSPTREGMFILVIWGI